MKPFYLNFNRIQRNFDKAYSNDVLAYSNVSLHMNNFKFIQIHSNKDIWHLRDKISDVEILQNAGF